MSVSDSEAINMAMYVTILETIIVTDDESVNKTIREAMLESRDEEYVSIW